jgi:hypothetical protein
LASARGEINGRGIRIVGESAITSSEVSSKRRSSGIVATDLIGSEVSSKRRSSGIVATDLM